MSRDVAYLKHILDAIRKIELYVSAGRDAFMAEPIRQDAVIRELEIIGEAAKRLSDAVRTGHPNIPWRRIAGLRDILIHNYMGVDLPAVWVITQTNLHELKSCVEAIILGQIAEAKKLRS